MTHLLLLYAATLVPVSLLSFQYATKRARITGTLAQY